MCKRKNEHFYKVHLFHLISIDPNPVENVNGISSVFECVSGIPFKLLSNYYRYHVQVLKDGRTRLSLCRNLISKNCKARLNSKFGIMKTLIFRARFTLSSTIFQIFQIFQIQKIFTYTGAFISYQECLIFNFRDWNGSIVFQ